MYKITRGQLYILFILGLVSVLYGMALSSIANACGLCIFSTPTWTNYEIHNFHAQGFFLKIVIPLILIFYTIGWKNFNKKSILTGKDLK